ncbi:MAG: diacylglycerol/lipid kinase family protein, partial [Bacteroidota bacterium]
MRKIKIILNPTAGMNSASKRIPLIEKLFLQHGLDYDIVLTLRKGHAAEIAEQTDGSEFDVIVAAGGDGTCNEVLNGLMMAKHAGQKIPAMAALPIGRGNDFHHAMGLPHGVEENINIIARDHRQAMDVGKVTGGYFPHGRYFGNGIGVGFSTIVGFEAAKLKFIHGFITYVVGAVKTLFLYYHAPDLMMELDEQVLHQRSIETSVMIGRRFGGAFFIAPSAVNNDGLFDLCITANPPRLAMLNVMAKYMKGTQHTSPYVAAHRARRVVLTAKDGALAVHADGETICEKGERIEIECLPKE